MWRLNLRWPRLSVNIAIAMVIEPTTRTVRINVFICQSCNLIKKHTRNAQLLSSRWMWSLRTHGSHHRKLPARHLWNLPGRRAGSRVGWPQHRSLPKEPQVWQLPETWSLRGSVSSLFPLRILQDSEEGRWNRPQVSPQPVQQGVQELLRSWSGQVRLLQLRCRQDKQEIKKNEQ